jgi:CDP-diacylglycerol--serine O-phosphatidyltransferase
MRRLPVLPNIITALGLTCGLFVIFKISMTPLGEADLHVLTLTAGILLLAAFADFVDGALARILKAESVFGSFFDSLADAISFGAAPSVIVLKTLSIPPGTFFSFLMTMGALIFSVSGVLRLARYNTMALQLKPPEEGEAGIKNFTGLPIPAAAAALVSLNLFLISNEFRNFFNISQETHAWILFLAMVVLGYFMISRWKFPSLKSLHIRVSSFLMVFLTAILAVFLFYGILSHFPVAFFLISWGYVAAAWILSIARLIAGRKSKSLEDYEPEPDDELD